MPDQNTKAEEKLLKLGQRLRQGFARQHAVTEQSLETDRQERRARAMGTGAERGTRECCPPEPH